MPEGGPGSGVVKSAGRVLEILELMSRTAQPLRITDVVTALGYPQASAAALLHSLATLGYAHYDRRRRVFSLTARVALLGNWIRPDLVADGAHLELARDLGFRTGNTVVIGARNGLDVQYIHVVNGKQADAPRLRRGTTRRLTLSTAGHALIAHDPEDRVRRLVNRINTEVPPERVVKASALLGTLQQARRRGYVFNRDLVAPGFGMLAAPLPVPRDHQKMVIGLAGKTEEILQNEALFAGLLRRAFGRAQ